jgi:hypothetical protein
MKITSDWTLKREQRKALSLYDWSLGALLLWADEELDELRRSWVADEVIDLLILVHAIGRYDSAAALHVLRNIKQLDVPTISITTLDVKLWVEKQWLRHRLPLEVNTVEAIISSLILFLNDE